MKNALLVLMVFCLSIGFAGNTLGAGNDGSKPEEMKSKSSPAKEEKASTENSRFDEATTQYLKKQRSINSELVAAHRELYRYNNPERRPKGISMADIVDQESSSREAKKQEQAVNINKIKTEEKISGLQKDMDNLKQDMLKYYNGKLPKHVSDAWQTEEGYTSYLISKTK